MLPRDEATSRALLDQPQQPVARVVVVAAPSTMTPLRAPVMRASTAPGFAFSAASAPSPADERQRHEVALGPAVGVLDRHDGEERRRRAVAQRRPVGEARLADLARLRREPALPLQERPQRLPLEHRARAAVEHVLPVDADEQRRQRLEDRGVRDRRPSSPAAVTCTASRCSVNQYDAYGPSVRKYGCSPIRGNSVSPAISIGIRPANAFRSSSAGCTARDRLATTRIVSRSSRRR